VQLRQDNVVGSLYNMVGFQTNLKWGEQKRVFSMIPGLKDIDIVRYGVMHQNIYINSPKFLKANMELDLSKFVTDGALAQRNSAKIYSNEAESQGACLLGEARENKADSKRLLYFAGQITGVEGYTESAATGIVAARDLSLKLGASKLSGGEDFILPKETMLGALTNYISSADPENFQPMNSNWGIVNTNPDDMEKKVRKDKKLKNEFLAKRALELVQASF